MNKFVHSNYLHGIPSIYHHCTLDNFDFSAQKNPEEFLNILENFVIGENKRKGLYLYGRYGVGKTHLLISLYRIILAREQDLGIVHYLSCEKMMRDIFHRIDQKESTSDYIEFVSSFEWLFLDDLTAIPKKDFPLEVLRQVINYRYEHQLATVFTANCSPGDLLDMDFHPHAISRIEGMTEILLIEGQDRRRM